ncbi:hypothetical protein [Brevundimonas sp.]|uniref:hypothetical protein n=1 Tax=Brevundimonas sp. TaxID=1871086 RepID=UPI002D45690D|nr:hypothetical protein [Brevundimonas sp.]HYC75269.1 hypothetical protein [Brevundimonas sp.]
MKKALIPVLAIAAASVAVPAAAQNYDRYDRYERNDRDGRYDRDRYDRGDRYDRDDRYENRGHWQSISQRKYQLDRRIEAGLRNGSLSRREASRLQVQLNSLIRLERSYMRGGLTRWERNDLDRRYDRLAVQVRMERRDRDNRRW